MTPAHPKHNEKSVSIHPTAIVSPSAVIGSGCIIHPYAVIGPKTHLGPDCEVHPFAHIGAKPQVRETDNLDGSLIIGAKNRFFEGCTVSLGRDTFGGVTKIGNNNVLMAYTHVGHDCVLGNGITIANHSSLAGHVEVQDHANIGGYVGIHQFVRVGLHAFVAANSMLSKDLLPFGIAAGDRARLIGFNRKGLARAQFSKDAGQAIRRAFRVFAKAPTEHRHDGDEYWSQYFSAFTHDSKRGVLNRKLCLR